MVARTGWWLTPHEQVVLLRYSNASEPDTRNFLSRLQKPSQLLACKDSIELLLTTTRTRNPHNWDPCRIFYVDEIGNCTVRIKTRLPMHFYLIYTSINQIQMRGRKKVCGIASTEQRSHSNGKGIDDSFWLLQLFRSFRRTSTNKTDPDIVAVGWSQMVTTLLCWNRQAGTTWYLQLHASL